MKLEPLKLLLLKGLLFLIIGLVLWIYLQPSYSKLIVSVSQEVVTWLQGEGMEKTWIGLQGNMILYIPRGLIAGEKKNIFAWKRDIRDIHYNSVILFALILFSPGLGFGKRGWVLMAGLTLLFLIQVLTVLVQAKFIYVFQMGEYSRAHYRAWDRNIIAFLKQFLELIGKFSFPFAIWMLFTYKETTGYLAGAREAKPRKRRKR
ncbi:MAG: exosortase H-associated membrane protein [Thermodesulfobacteriota bacterium]|jgi:hypothetical protein